MKFRLLLLTVFVATGCASSRPATPLRSAGTPETLVVWVSVDGFRPDYLDRADAPFLKAMRNDGAYSRALTPTYPSLTFSVHSSEITGASPKTHGIPGNSFYDRTLSEQFNFPNRPELLKAEPIWTTATRAGQRVAVIDWPFSQKQKGITAAAYFTDTYDSKLPDEHRLGKLNDLMKYDDGGPAHRPLSLLIGYADAVDKAGHQVGPSAAAPAEQLARVDRILADVHAHAVDLLRRKYPPGSTLYFLVSTDHGMARVTHVANLKSLIGNALPPDAKIVTGGGTGHVFLTESPNKPAQVAAILAALKPHAFARAYTHATLKPAWNMLDPARVGDVYVDLAPGYTFSSRAKLPVTAIADEPTTRPTDASPKGMHSYDPAESPDMRGMLLISRYPKNFGGKDLGPIDARTLAPTVAAWLRIPPPPQAEVEPIPAVSR